MKNISESFEDIQNISTYLRNNIEREENINEGVKDVFNKLKTKFKQIFNYLKSVVVKVGNYFIPTDINGELLPAISPLTAGEVYKNNTIDTSNTCVILEPKAARIVGSTRDYSNLKNLYGEGNSLDFWKSLPISEGLMNMKANINEVKLSPSDSQAKNIIDSPEMLAKVIKMNISPTSKMKPLLIWGAPGIGKTAIIEKVADEMKKTFPDYSLICKTLSDMNPDDFTLPAYTEINGQQRGTDIPKSWLPVYKKTGDPEKDAQADEACGRGLLFVDELSRATPQVLNVILPLINERRLNDCILGSGWKIIAASNRMEDELSGQSSIGNAAANRFVQYNYAPSFKGWKKWAEKQNFISPLLLQWLSLPESETLSGAKFYYMDPNETMELDTPTTIFCTPRSWTDAMITLCEFANTGSLEGFTIFDIPKNIIEFALGGSIPAVAIDSFMAFLDIIKRIGDFDKAVDAVWKRSGKGFNVNKKDLSKISIPIAQLICTSHKESLPTATEFESLADWLVSTDSDQLASYVLDTFKAVFIDPEYDTRSQNIINGFFVIHKKIAKLEKEGNTAEKKQLLNVYKEYWKKFGITDLKDFPDYSTGLKKIADKYGKIFKETIIDDREGLG